MKKYLIPGLVFTLSAALALYNIGNFPKMIGDEGIYVSQAYWLAFLGKLGPYTYWYDHFPLGWAQIGLWQRLVGPAGFLGYTVLSGRVLMGLALGGTTTLIYLLAKNLTKSKIISLLASLIFILSSLTLTFGRMVLLDNLANFWFILSLYLLFTNPTRLKNLILSSLTLSLAVLTKESLLFFLPPYLFAMYKLNLNNPYKKYALLVGTTTLIFLLSFFPLLAILKDEFFPQSNQVSFLETLLFQSSRGSGIPFYAQGSHFREMLNTWVTIDPVFMFLGLGSVLLTLILPLGFNYKILSLFSIFFLLFLIRGGQIYEFYIIPLLPLFALNISLLIDYFKQLTKSSYLALILMIVLLGYFAVEGSYPLSSLATSPQKKSLDSLMEIPGNSTIVANNYPFLDIYLQGKNQIHWYQKIESDQAIREATPEITHLLVDTQFANELSADQLPFLKSILERQSTKIEFGPLLAPGENVKPFSTENLSLYSLSETSDALRYVVSLEEITPEILDSISLNPPYGILLTNSNFTNSSDLESTISNLKTKLPTTKIITTQDDTGKNTIPWITSSTRTFYKSGEEASSSTQKKTDALKKLGFTAAIITSSNNLDGYLGDIIKAASPNLIPIVRFEEEIPESNLNLLVKSLPEVELLQQAKYPGELLYLVTSLDYLKIKD